MPVVFLKDLCNVLDVCITSPKFSVVFNGIFVGY